MENLPEEPKGVEFYSIRTGETHYCKLGATISAYINSSDMGVNASRGQDYGWRLGAEWVKRVRAFRRDEDKMDTLAAKLRLEDGVSPTTTQILYYIYGRQVRAYLQSLRDNDAPFEEEYQKAISGRQQPVADDPLLDVVTEDVDEADLLPSDDEDTDIEEEIKASATRARGGKPKSTQAK